jgi:hypothetical protein
MRAQLMLMVAVLSLAIPFAHNAAQAPSEAPAPEEVIASIPWITLESVELVETEDDETVFTVSYVATEYDMVAYRAEMLEIFRVVGQVVPDEATAVTLIPMIDIGVGLQGIEAATIEADALPDYLSGDLTRTMLLETMTSTPLEHGSGGAVEQAPA